MSIAADRSGSPRILGIDPGLQITGYAVIEAGPQSPRVCEAGVIRSGLSRAKHDLASRITALYNGIVEVIDQFQPQTLAVEQLYDQYQHPRTAILMAHACGVIFFVARQREVPVVSYNATRI